MIESARIVEIIKQTDTPFFSFIENSLIDANNDGIKEIHSWLKNEHWFESTIFIK